MRGLGHTVNLPCVSPSVGSCSDIRWHRGTRSETAVVARIPRRGAVYQGELVDNTGRFNILSNCSLHINNITQVDVGRYWCSKDLQASHYLSLITGE